jgi:hypothetical protein
LISTEGADVPVLGFPPPRVLCADEKENVNMIGSKRTPAELVRSVVAARLVRRRRALRAFILVLTAVLGPSVAACSGQAGTASPPPETAAPASTSAGPTVAPTTAPTSAPTKTPAPTPALPAPAALQGRWRAVIEPGVAILTFTATDYKQTWLGGGSGQIEVEGDEITFSGSRECPGSGIYRWSIEADKLHLEPVGTDACPFRADWAGNRTYTRYD